MEGVLHLSSSIQTLTKSNIANITQRDNKPLDKKQGGQPVFDAELRAKLVDFIKECQSTRKPRTWKVVKVEADRLLRAERQPTKAIKRRGYSRFSFSNKAWTRLKKLLPVKNKKGE